MAYVDWRMNGQGAGSCNCDWGCPCQFNALPTHGDCTGFMAMRIDEGHFGDVKLDGLRWVGMYKWPGPIHEGNGTFQSIIDERADDAQRKALVAILHGEETAPGATMLQVFSTTVTNRLDPVFAPIEFSCNQETRQARVAVPAMLDSTLGPIVNPITGNEHRAQIHLPHGFEYTVADMASGTTKATGGIELDLSGTYGQIAKIHLTQNGVMS